MAAGMVMPGRCGSGRVELRSPVLSAFDLRQPLRALLPAWNEWKTRLRPELFVLAVQFGKAVVVQMERPATDPVDVPTPKWSPGL